MFPKKYLPEDKMRQKICQSSPELRALAAKLEQVKRKLRYLHDLHDLHLGIHKQRESGTHLQMVIKKIILKLSNLT